MITFTFNSAGCLFESDLSGRSRNSSGKCYYANSAFAYVIQLCRRVIAFRLLAGVLLMRIVRTARATCSYFALQSCALDGNENASELIS